MLHCNNGYFIFISFKSKTRIYFLKFSNSKLVLPSNVRPQCLQTIASCLTYSAQYGHFLVSPSFLRFSFSSSEEKKAIRSPIGPSKTPSANPPHPLLPLPLAIMAPTIPRPIQIIMIPTAEWYLPKSKPEGFNGYVKEYRHHRNSEIEYRI